jgi:hypothetical protein
MVPVAPLLESLSLRLSEAGKSNRETSALQPPAIAAKAAMMIGCRQPE